ncbi:hypothetical protein LguiA_036594 [Lonicera macranthoides]
MNESNRSIAIRNFQNRKKNRNRNKKSKPKLIDLGRYGWGIQGPRIGPKKSNL